MPRIPINGIEMDYQEYGEGDAVVFLHGAGGNLLSWWQQIPTFSEEYRCVTLSHRGFGHSYDVPDGPGVTAFVDDLVALLDHLEIESAHLVAAVHGWSHRARIRRRVCHPHAQPCAGGHHRRHGRAGRRERAKRVAGTPACTRVGFQSGLRRLSNEVSRPRQPVPPDLAHQPAASQPGGRSERRAARGRACQPEGAGFCSW